MYVCKYNGTFRTRLSLRGQNLRQISIVLESIGLLTELNICTCQKLRYTSGDKKAGIIPEGFPEHLPILRI